jgi:sulfur relay (sulfurtransferase) complex TusBCD TusD component (DsrE family)
MNKIEIKMCKKCGEFKSLEEFYSHKQALGRKINICKTCTLKRQKHSIDQDNEIHLTKYEKKRNQDNYYSYFTGSLR